MQKDDGSRYLAYSLMIISKTILIVAHWAIKNLAQTFGIFQIMALMFNGIVLLRFSYYYLGFRNLSLQVSETKLFVLLLARQVIASISMGLFLITLKFIPIGVANTFFNMTPIFMYFIEAVYHKKKLNYKHLLLTIISFSGVVMIFQPKFLFENNSSQISGVFVLMALLSAFLNSVSMFMLSQIKKTTISELTVLQTYFMVQGIFGAFLANFETSEGNVQIQGWMVFYSILMMLFNVGSQILLYKSLYLGEPSLVLPFSYAGIIASVLVDFYYFNQNLSRINIIGIFVCSIGLVSKLLIQ